MAGSVDSMMLDSAIEHTNQSQSSASTSPTCKLSGYSWNTRDARYQPFPSMGDRHQSDMAEMCRPNPLPRWQRAKNYAKRKKEPFSSFRNNADITDTDCLFPTSVCQHLGCWQETLHEHSEDEIAHHSEASKRIAREPEDYEQHVRNYLRHFEDDEQLMRQLRPPRPEQTPTRPPPRLRGPGNSRSLIDRSKQGTRELRHALPTISENRHHPAILMSLPIRPRPPGPVAGLRDKSVESAGAPTVTRMQSDALDPPDGMSSTTMRPGDLALKSPNDLPWEEALAGELEKAFEEEARMDET